MYLITINLSSYIEKKNLGKNTLILGAKITKQVRSTWKQQAVKSAESEVWVIISVTGLSNPLYFFDWIYFNTPAGHQFLHYCDIVHKFSESVILQRREELLKVVILKTWENTIKYFVHIIKKFG